MSLSASTSSIARQPFLPISLAFAAGIVLADFFPLNAVLPAAVFSGLLLALLLLWRRLSGSAVVSLLLLLFLLMGATRLGLWRETTLNPPFAAHLPLNVDTLQVEIVSARHGHRLSAEAQIRRMSWGARSTAAAGRIMLYFPYQMQAELPPGKSVQLAGVTLTMLSPPRNPGQFNYADYLRRHGFVAECRVRDPRQVHISGQPPAFSVDGRIMEPLRRKLTDNLDRFLDPSAAGFLKALLLGVREDLPAQTREDFQKAGVMHVLAISGLHVGFVALILHVLISFLPVFFKQRNLMVMASLIFYMLLTGANPPVVRATLMACLYFLAINLERRRSVGNFLFAAAFLILLFQPQQLFWAGFQFSFAAVFAIVYFHDYLKPAAELLIGKVGNARLKSLLRNVVLLPLLVSAAAQLGTIPLTLYYFHLFSLVSFLLNLLVIPYTGLLVAGGFFLEALSFISSPMASVFGEWLGAQVHWLLALVSAAAHLPLAYFPVAHFGWLEMFLYLAALLWFFSLRRRLYRGRLTAVFLLLLTFWAWSKLSRERSFNLLVLDVGQGDAALLCTPQGKTLLVDAGPAGPDFSSADFAILPAMRFWGVERIHRLFLSHPHLDHIGGAFALVQKTQVDSVYLPFTPVKYQWNDSLVAVLRRRAVPFRYLRMGDHVQIDSETRVYVLGPSPQFSRYAQAGGEEINNNSLVLLLRHRRHSLLFAGDAEAAAEAQLSRWKDLLKSDYLKVGHHGSKTSTTAAFLEQVSPRLASISVGAGNKFGHPSALVLKRLKAHEVQYYRTDRQRALWLRLRNDRWEKVDW